MQDSSFWPLAMSAQFKAYRQVPQRSIDSCPNQANAEEMLPLWALEGHEQPAAREELLGAPVEVLSQAQHHKTSAGNDFLREEISKLRALWSMHFPKERKSKPVPLTAFDRDLDCSELVLESNQQNLNSESSKTTCYGEDDVFVSQRTRRQPVIWSVSEIISHIGHPVAALRLAGSKVHVGDLVLQ